MTGETREMLSAAADQELFGHGWMKRQLDRLMDAVAASPPQYWPRLTGDRAMSQPSIDAELTRRRETQREGA